MRPDGAGGVGGRWPPGSLLGMLTPEQQECLIELGTQRTVDRGERLIVEGARDRTAYLLLRGAVKVVSDSVAGQPVLLAVRLEGDLVGELAALHDMPRVATVVTVARTTFHAIRHDTLTAHLAADPNVHAAVHRSVAAKLHQATRMRTDTGTATALVRLARVLVALGDRYGRPAPQGTLLDMHLTQAELVALIGIADKSVHRALGELRARGLVRTGYRQLLLTDPAALADLTASS